MFDPSMKRLYGLASTPFLDSPHRHVGSAFLEGYEGQVQKAVRMALRLPVGSKYRVLRCADGTRRGCRGALIRSLRATVQRLGEDPGTYRAPVARDEIDFEAVGLLDVASIPWQNRPTFQQVVQVRSHRRR
jgi:hypothetical protein